MPTQGVFLKHLISTQSLAAIALTLGAFAAASSAHARSDVTFSVGVQVPGVYVQSAPVYVQPRPIYMPAPGNYGRYDDGRRYDGQHWQHHAPYGNRDRDGIANVYDSSGPRNQWHQAHLYGPYGDLDRDGVPNRYDRAPNNPSRR
jgi:hypothetical protein